MKDPLTHGRKTISGTDLTFGATTTTPCGKKRSRERTSTDPAAVDCPDCRAWFAEQEREMTSAARAAADIAIAHPHLALCTPEEFTHIAWVHDVRAERWEEQP